MKRRKVFFIFLLVGWIVFSLGCTQRPKDSAMQGSGPESEIGEMSVYVFSIGKADAILIQTENHTVMIDAGLNKDGDAIVEGLARLNVTEIDSLIITHFDKDHVGGADTVLRTLPVKEVIVPNYQKDSKQYRQFLEAADETGLIPNVLLQKKVFVLDQSEFTLYPSQRADGRDMTDEDESEENNFSVVVKIRHGNHHFLFTGDAMAQRLEELLAMDEITGIAYDFLKAPHHGKYNQRSEAFISAIRPRYTVITCSQEKAADDRIVSALKKIGSDVFFTTEGAVYCKSDGSHLSVTYE